MRDTIGILLADDHRIFRKGLKVLLSEYATDPLEEYNPTRPEKLAIATRDISWIEEHVGPLTRP